MKIKGFRIDKSGFIQLDKRCKEHYFQVDTDGYHKGPVCKKEDHQVSNRDAKQLRKAKFHSSKKLLDCK